MNRQKLMPMPTSFISFFNHTVIFWWLLLSFSWRYWEYQSWLLARSLWSWSGIYEYNYQDVLVPSLKKHPTGSISVPYSFKIPWSRTMFSKGFISDTFRDVFFNSDLLNFSTRSEEMAKYFYYHFWGISDYRWWSL